MLWPAVAFAAGATLFETTALDRRVADLFFDAPGSRWIWGESFWSNELVHSGGRDLVAVVGVASLVILIAGLTTTRWRAARRAALFVVSSLVVVTGGVALLKRATHVDCPRDLLAYGGARPYVRLLERRYGEDAAERAPGACFPGGHSSGAFALLSLYFLGRDRDRPGAAWRITGLAAVLVLGLVFAIGQWARGAHFPSHDLWSAAIAWFVALGLYAGPFRARLRA